MNGTCIGLHSGVSFVAMYLLHVHIYLGITGVVNAVLHFEPRDDAIESAEYRPNRDL